MCVFPKSFEYNGNEPTSFPFPRKDDGWDFDRFDFRFLSRLELRVRELAEVGVQADVILFHPYDRWGFSSMPAAADDRYVRHLVRRLAGFDNVWWSLANEYDLLSSKSAADWERFGTIITEEDPYQHLTSIHQFRDMFDHSHDWITHVSAQRIDSFSGVENIPDWRQRWDKPVIVDECGYEGDIGQAWGNLTGEELVRAFWEGTLRGGYVGHGETYLNDAEVLWWSKGGLLVGSSPSRIEFLEQVCASAGLGHLEPVENIEWGSTWAGDPHRALLGYFGRGQSRFADIHLPRELTWAIEIVDTWEMTSTPLVGSFVGETRIPLPGKPYIAVLARSIGVN
jgi:hypothetical protein